MQENSINAELIYILTFLGMFGLACAIVLFSVIYNNKRKGFELKESVMRLEQEKALVDSEISSSEKERDRIAKQLHDDINNRLTFLKMQTSLIKNDEIKATLSTEIDNTISEIRDLSHSISAQNVEHFGLLVGLKSIQKTINAGDEMEIKISSSEAWEGLKNKTDVLIYRICQEWIGNSIKHGKAKEVTISLNSNESAYSLLFQDNGIGMNIDQVKERNQGHGMNNILARVQRIDGSLTQKSAPREGVKFELTWNK